MSHGLCGWFDQCPPPLVGLHHLPLLLHMGQTMARDQVNLDLSLLQVVINFPKADRENKGKDSGEQG